MPSLYDLRALAAVVLAVVRATAPVLVAARAAALVLAPMILKEIQSISLCLWSMASRIATTPTVALVKTLS